jgi:hypothetical protein
MKYSAKVAPEYGAMYCNVAGITVIWLKQMNCIYIASSNTFTTCATVEALTNTYINTNYISVSLH